MKKYIAFYLVLSSLTVSHLAVGQATNKTSTSQKVTPSQAYSQLANDVANLMKRATTMPDREATALLRKESPSLQERAKQVKPAYQNWLKTLSPPEIKAEEKRIFTTPWGKYFSDLDPKLGAKIGRNQALGQQVMSLMSIFDGV